MSLAKVLNSHEEILSFVIVSAALTELALVPPASAGRQADPGAPVLARLRRCSCPFGHRKELSELPLVKYGMAVLQQNLSFLPTNRR